MRKNYFSKTFKALLAIVSCCAFMNVWAIEIHVQKAGTLPTLLPTCSENTLKLTGSINGTDVKHLRQLIGAGVTSLDLAGVKIVSGGVAYDGTNKTENDVIGPAMFKECTKLRSIELPTSISAILSNAFARSGLTKVDIPNSVSRLGGDAFAYCSSLNTVVIGSRVSKLDQGVFYSSPVKTVYSKPQTPPSAPAYFFSSKPTIRVYTSSLAEYKTSNWKDFAGSFVGNLEKYYPQEADSSTIINERLGTYFEDAACTQLKAEYQAMSDEELTKAMSEGEMPSFMIEIAIKVKNDKWAAYEKDFRIHNYTAYSDANYWNDKMRSSGGSYMGNPTGIYCKDLNPLYVFVDGDVPEKATLYMAGCVDNDLISNAKTGKKLTKGLNIVDGTKDALYYILYTADTKDKTKKLSEWPAIKIHIQGGTVNGYYDSSRHTDKDYLALLNKATHDLFTIKGKESLFNLKRTTYKQVWPKSIDRSICWFDSMAVWQKELMGMSEAVVNGKRAHYPYCLTGGEDIFPTYYNNPNFAIQGNESSAGYANASTYRTCYNSLECIANCLNVTNPNHDEWCVGHEVGHNNQGAINLEGGTEVSNNLFSNFCRFLTGNVTSAGDALSSSMYEYAQGIPFSKRGGLMRMYYQLYLYYHLGQRNTSFFPELFKELRRDPLTDRYKNTNNSSLKFVRKVCEIAQEDLTDFFEAWGFFVPCSNLPISDYGDYTMTVKITDINRTKATIAKYTRKNREILFVEDRVDYVPRQGYFALPGKERRDSHQVGQCGDLGQFTDFQPGAKVEPSSYTCIQSDSLYVMNGTGGVGFIMLSPDEKLRYASNSLKFCIPSRVENDYTIYSVDADGTLQPVTIGGSGTEIVKVDKVGTLSDSLTTNAIKAIISGGINGTDIKYMRQLINEGNLQSIDLTDARMVSGGLPFLQSYRASSNAIASHAFFECMNLVAIRLPKTITKIDTQAFANSGLREVTIPESVTTVGGDAFAYCPQLSRVIIGSKVKNMAQGVFYSSAVKEAFVMAKTPPTIANYLFSSKPIIHVYASSLAAYKASSWANFGTLVGDLDDYGHVTSVELPQYKPQDVLKNTPVYDLNGRRVTDLLPATIYVQDGKKFITAP